MATRYKHDILGAAVTSEIVMSASWNMINPIEKDLQYVKSFWYFAIGINPIERKSNLAWEIAAIEDTFDVLNFHVQFVSSQGPWIFLSKKQSVSSNLR